MRQVEPCLASVIQPVQSSGDQASNPEGVKGEMGKVLADGHRGLRCAVWRSQWRRRCRSLMCVSYAHLHGPSIFYLLFSVESYGLA